MYLDTTIILIAMVVAFALSSIFLKTAEISMIIAASVGILFGVAHGWTSSFSRVL